MNNTLVLMMGIPGSGKSTIATRLATKKDIYISRDKIRFSLLKDGEDYFSKERLVLKTFINNINKAIETNKYRFIIADATHLSTSSRGKILNHLTTKPKNIFILYIDTPLEIALNRNEGRTERAYVPPQQIIKMYNSIEMPKKEEGISAVFVLDEHGRLNFKKTKELINKEDMEYYDLF